jgi:butyryl-CoA dehydrogenase
MTPDQQALRDAARRFARNELKTVAEEIEHTGIPPSRDLVKRFAEQGFLAINTPEEYGGLGLGNLEALIVLEELAQISAAVAFPVFEACVGPVRAIERFGSESLKRRVIPRVCRGDMLVAVSMSEPDAGTALTDLTTRAQIRGDRILINGVKRWCSGGGHADAYVVYCRLSDTLGAGGLGAVLVERDAAGLSFGAPERLMGFRGVPSSDLRFDDCAVPLDNLIVPAGGFGKLMAAFDLERCGNATMALAQAAAALEDALSYVVERRQFGKPIVEFQAVQLKLADMRMKVDASRLLIHRAAVQAASGLPSMLDSSVAKCFANTMAREVTGDAMQLMGAYGYSTDFAIERRFRDAWGWGIAGGVIDIQKVNIAGAMVGRRFDQRR